MCKNAMHVLELITVKLGKGGGGEKLGGRKLSKNEAREKGNKPSRHSNNVEDTQGGLVVYISFPLLND